jgi:nucleotide-binding universal stress UspA family protein
MALEAPVSLLRRILVATDFSSAGHSAVARAGQLADQYQCQLMVCHATPDWTLFSERAIANQQHYAEITRNAEELMRREIAWLGEEHRVTTARGEVTRDRATIAVSRAIASFQPDLLVIGAGGEHILLNGETVLGGTALKLIARVTIPLLLVRKPSPVAYASTLAAVGGDLSAARRLTRWAGALAGSGTCHVVRAYEAPYANRMQLCNFDAAEIAQSAEEQRRLAQQDCEVLERTAEPGTHLVFHILRGPPVSTVLGQIKQFAPQLVVIGQHAHHADEHPGAWAAGLGTRIAYHSPTDVLMVP